MNYITSLYKRWEINPATLSGAIDVIVVEQPDGTFTCSPFHVRFGKIGVLRSKEKVVDIEINGETVDIHMKLGESGEAFFVQEVPPGDLSAPSHTLLSACSLTINENTLQCVADGIPPAENGNRTISLCQDLEIETFGSRQEGDETEGVSEGNIMERFKAVTVTSKSISKSEVSASDVDSSLIFQDHLDSSSGTSNEYVTKTGGGVVESNADEDSSSSELTTRHKRKRKKRSVMKKNSKTGISNKVYRDQEKQNEGEKDCTLCIDCLDVSSSKLSINKTNDEEVDKNKEQVLNTDAFKVTDIHFFSDSEVMPGSSFQDNKPHTQVKSDTEYEAELHMSKVGESEVGGANNLQSWAWGELPTTNEGQEKPHQSWIHRLFWFMKKSHVHQSQGEIFLSDIDIDKMEPEKAKMYFPTDYNTAQDGQVLNEVNIDSDGILLKSISVQTVQVREDIDSDFEEPKNLSSEVLLSLCGGLTANTTPTEEAFHHHVITYDEFVVNPMIMNDPNLVIRIDGEMYNWQVAGAIILSLASFHRPLPKEAISKLFVDPTSRVVEQQRTERAYSWFHWGSRPTEPPVVASPCKEQTAHTDTTTVKGVATDKVKGQYKVSKTKTEVVHEGVISAAEPFQTTNSVNSHVVGIINSSKSQHSKNSSSRWSLSSDRHRKTLRLTSEQISNLNLRDGVNEIEFSVTTALQGTTKCKCFLFKWRYDDKIVVSDIDGTITKSDILGHVLCIVGKDWSQRGVTKLFTKIRNNGYKLLYLSSRAIGQSEKTRDYLKSLRQEDLPLPEGPMLLNPTGLINAFHMEVIAKKPEKFKISCLKDIQALFPPSRQTFYAGFGNKINDSWAYRAVGIPIVRIFTINHRGEVRNEISQTFKSSFSNLTQIVNQMFPAMPFIDNLAEDFSHFNYWRDPIPEIDISPM